LFNEIKKENIHFLILFKPKKSSFSGLIIFQLSQSSFADVSARAFQAIIKKFGSSLIRAEGR
jgi:hypothetical protein